MNNIAGALNSRLRMNGLASGLDVDGMVQQLMKVDRLKIDRVTQNRQLLEWKRDDYRSITNALRAFKDEYFELMKPNTNFTSPSAFSAFSITPDANGYVTATAGPGAAAGTHNIFVHSSATTRQIQGMQVTGNARTSMTPTDYNLKGNQISVTLDGVTKTIELDNYGDMATLKTNLQSALDTAFGAGRMNIAIDDHGTAADVSDDTLEFSALNGSTFTIAEAPNNFISTLGFSNGQQNFIIGADIAEYDRTHLSTFNGKQFKLTIGGVEKTITLNGLTDLSTVGDLASAVKTGINDQFGAAAANIEVLTEGNKLTIKTLNGDPIALKSVSTNNILGKLGFANGAAASGKSSIDVNLSGDETGRTFTVNIDGEDVTVKIDKDYDSGDAARDYDDLAQYIKGQLGAKFTGDISAVGSKLVFSGDQKLVFKKGPEDSLTKLGFSAADSKSNSISLNSSLFSIKDYFTTDLNVDDATKTQTVKFTINGVEIDVKKSYETATLNDVMSAVNSSNAGVELRYDSLNKRFTLTSKTEGAAGKTDCVDNSQGLLKSMGLIDDDPVTPPNIKVVEGKDAVFDLDGVINMQRSSNQFTIDGITYTLKPDLKDVSSKIEVKADVDALYKKIEGFVNKYNEVIGKVYGKTVEKRPRTNGDKGDYYLPLTSEQKEAMKENDIKLWEEKAKTGLLRSDPTLQKIAYSMRDALYAKVDGVDISLYDIGITTSKNYLDGGKLVIDEAKLKKAIQEKPNQIADLFSKESEYKYGDSDHSKDRFGQEGIAQRLNDVFEDSIRTRTYGTGHKGILLEKAGIEGDVTEFNNLIYDELKDTDTLLGKLADKMAEREEWYYLKFAAMEKAISQMNAQSSWIGAQMGQNG